TLSSSEQDQARANISAPLKGHIYGLTLSNNTTDATNDIDITAGEAASDATAPMLMTLASGITKRLDGSWAVGSGNGGLDTGSIANTWYYVWLIMRSDTGVVDALFSTSAASPTMPANYDHKRLIGAIYRTGGAINLFTQYVREFVWDSPVTDFSSGSVGTSGALVTLTVPPVAGTKAKVGVFLSNSNGGNAWVRAASVANDAVDTANADISIFALQSGRATSELHIPVNSSGQVRYRSDGSSVGLFRIMTKSFTLPEV